MLVVKKDYETAKNKAFTVSDNETGKVHSVLFKGDKGEWSCDCTWNSLKETPCRHIKEVQKRFGKEEAKKVVRKLGV